jgi:uncharacterized protein (TIGR02679 family)
MNDASRLRALLGGSDTAWLITRLRSNLEAGRRVDGTLALQQPTDAQREAVARLFGRQTSTGSTLTVRLPELDTLLRRAGLSEGIADAVTLLCGPIVDVRGNRDEAERQWDEVFLDAVQRAGARVPIRRWLDDLRTTGLLRRLARRDAQVGRALIAHALDVADRLPGSGIPLAELASAATGDSHALDLGQPVGTLVLRLAALLGVPAQNALSRRDIWTNVGVLCDELSAPVLTLNLHADESTPIGRVLSIHAELGEPYRLSTRQLVRLAPCFAPAMSGRTVYVCENPTVVASAANQLGASSAPLVCIEGQIKTAARLLLTQLVASGAHLKYHGDFDWGGIRIANVVMSECGASEWRFSAGDYRVAPPGTQLRGRSVSACWDADLAALMSSSGRAVYEEQVLPTLLDDLASASG